VNNLIVIITDNVTIWGICGLHGSALT